MITIDTGREDMDLYKEGEFSWYSVSLDFKEEMEELAKKKGLSVSGNVYGTGHPQDNGAYWDANVTLEDENGGIRLNVQYEMETKYGPGGIGGTDLLLIKGNIFGKKIKIRETKYNADFHMVAKLLEPYFEANKNDILIEIAELQKQIDDLKKLIG